MSAAEVAKCRVPTTRGFSGHFIGSGENKQSPDFVGFACVVFGVICLRKKKTEDRG
jgi:hypothetical protein